MPVLNDVVELHDLIFPCVVGLLEREQRETQTLHVDLRMTLPLESVAETGDLSAGVNYATVTAHLRMLAEHGRFRLIESLGLAACRLLLAPPLPGEGRGQIHAVDLRIRKPEVMAPLTTPGVRMIREAPLALPTREIAGAAAEILIDLPQGGAWRIRVADGPWTPPGDLALEVICGEILADGRVLRAGDRLARGAGPVTAQRGAGLLGVGRLG